MARTPRPVAPAFRPDRTPEWAALRREAKRLGRTSIAELFAADRRRAARLTVAACGAAAVGREEQIGRAHV